jgi:hypothetical protein
MWEYSFLELGMQDTMFMWNAVLTLAVAPIGWFMKRQADEVLRLTTLLNRTREDYIKRSDHSDEMNKVTEHLIRLEAKIDRVSDKLSEKRFQ